MGLLTRLMQNSGNGEIDTGDWMKIWGNGPKQM